MSYAGRIKIHDADAHIFETPDWLIRYADPDVRSRLRPLDLHGQEAVIEEAANLEAKRGKNHAALTHGEILARNWEALGAFDANHRKHALDLLGFTSQLVFSTYSHLTFINNPGAPIGSDFSPEVLYGAVTAHNRGMVDFCSVDPRLLPVGWVAIDVPERAVTCCRQALEIGCAGIELPSYPSGQFSLTHPDLHPIYRMLEDCGCPLLFHVGGGGQVVSHVFSKNGRESIIHALTFVGISAPIELALSALVLDGIFDKFPRLMCGVIEHGATWFPGLMRRLDYAVGAFESGSARKTLRLWPSEYLLRNVRVTPFPFEDVGWLIRECGSCIFLFGSDYPHDEGGADPVSMFETTLARCSGEEREQFYWRNFEQMLGARLTDRIGKQTMAGSETSELSAAGSTEDDGLLDIHRSKLMTSSQSAENTEVSRKKALLRLLAREVAAQRGISVEQDELQAAVDEFRCQNGLRRLGDTHSWMEAAGVTEEILVGAVRDGILVERLGDALGEILDVETEIQVKLGSARVWQARGAAGTP
jgi:predicted TIM-barrel fold metal-dependent hydrolase